MAATVSSSAAMFTRFGGIISRVISRHRRYLIPVDKYGIICRRFLMFSLPRWKGDVVSITLTSYNKTKEITVTGPENSTILQLLDKNDEIIEEFATCSGQLACSSCHVIFSEEDYEKIPSKPCSRENDMLDMARGLTDTSRLGCQVKITKNLNGVRITLGPDGNRDGDELSEAESVQSRD